MWAASQRHFHETAVIERRLSSMRGDRQSWFQAELRYVQPHSAVFWFSFYRRRSEFNLMLELSTYKSVHLHYDKWSNLCSSFSWTVQEPLSGHILVPRWRLCATKRQCSSLPALCRTGAWERGPEKLQNWVSSKYECDKGWTWRIRVKVLNVLCRGISPSFMLTVDFWKCSTGVLEQAWHKNGEYSTSDTSSSWSTVDVQLLKSALWANASLPSSKLISHVDETTLPVCSLTEITRRLKNATTRPH